MLYDLLLTDGDVLDPAAGLKGRMDVAIAGGKIVAVGQQQIVLHRRFFYLSLAYHRPSPVMPRRHQERRKPASRYSRGSFDCP